jgi:iron complex transport system substrate-binding protein
VRIVSLVPSATETLFALGLDDEVIAVTHECDHPPAAADRPRVTRDLIGPGLSAAQIDAAVRERIGRGESIYELDGDRLGDLAPDLIVTQALCDVCAVSFDDVRAIAREIPSHPRVISLDPSTVGEVLEDVRRLGAATGRELEARALLRDAAERIDRIRTAVGGAPRPRVAALEWLDPVYVAGHWTPQLIDYAGGEDVLGFTGERSAQASWDEVARSRPDVVVVMPCGYDAPRARDEAQAHRAALDALGAGQVVAVDAAAYFSRPGPRLIEGLELLAGVLHPERVGDIIPAGDLDPRVLELA